jgi:alpha-L-fucosidase
MIREDIKAGQRIEKFHFEAWNGREWKSFAVGTTVGNKRLLRFPEVKARKVRFVVDESRSQPAVMDVGLFNGPGIDDKVN